MSSWEDSLMHSVLRHCGRKVAFSRSEDTSLSNWVTDWRQRKRWTHLSICLTFFFLPCLCELQQDWKCLVGLLGRTLERPKQQQFLTYRAVLAYSSSRAVRTGTESQVKQPKNYGKDNHCAAWWFWRASCSHAGRGRKHTRRPEGVHCPCHVLVIETDTWLSAEILFLVVGLTPHRCRSLAGKKD